MRIFNYRLRIKSDYFVPSLTGESCAAGVLGVAVVVDPATGGRGIVGQHSVLHHSVALQS